MQRLKRTPEQPRNTAPLVHQQVHDLRTYSDGLTTVYTLASPALGGAASVGGGASKTRGRTQSEMDPSDGMPYSTQLETAGKQDEVRSARESGSE
jgi:hypothetical protein